MKAKSEKKKKEKEKEEVKTREGGNVPFILEKSDGGFDYAVTAMSCLWYRLFGEKAK